MNQQNANPPTDHCNNTVAASRRITQRDATVVTVKRLGVGLAVAVLVSVVPGCMEGKRPVLIPAADANSRSSGDRGIDTVLRRLELAETATFEARFEVRTLLGNVVTMAEVAQDGLKRRAVRVGEVLYRDGSERDPVTCNTTTGRCEAGLDDTLIASLMITRPFFSTSAVARLEQHGRVATGAGVLEDREFAGVDTVCVTVPVQGGEPRYCATASGVLANYLGADTHITLVEFASELTEELGLRLLTGPVADS